MTTDDLTAALHACAAGLYPLEAGVAPLTGNGTFLVVGQRGTLLTSTHGVQWVPRSSGVVQRTAVGRHTGRRPAGELCREAGAAMDGNGERQARRAGRA